MVLNSSHFLNRFFRCVFLINVEPLICECFEKMGKKEKRKQIIKKKHFKLPIDY